jgi:RND family efflux transporter MFP subunit
MGGAVLASSLALGCGLFSSKGPGQAVTVAHPTTRTTSPQVTAASTLIASDSAKVTFPQEVRVTKFYVGVGDQVIKGDPILLLDDGNLRSQLKVKRAEQKEAVASAEKNLFLLENRDQLRTAQKMTDIQFQGIPKEVSAGEARVERIGAEIAAMEQSLGALTVMSPIDGLVTNRPVSLNQAVASDRLLLEIVNIHPIHAAFRLSADEAGGISVGDAVKVRMDELPGEIYDAHVRFVGPELHLPDRTFVVWAAMPNPMGILKIGMQAFTDFHSTKTHDVFVVPTSSIVMRRNQPHLFLIKDGIARMKRVTVKSIDKREAVLAGGVTTADWIAVQGQDELEDGGIVDMRR